MRDAILRALERCDECCLAVTRGIGGRREAELLCAAARLAGMEMR